MHFYKHISMKKVLIFVLSILAVNTAMSQSDKQLTHYMFDRMSYNPATTGMKGYCGTLIYRGQWDKVQDAPNTLLFNAQGNLQKFNSGVGLTFMSDVIGYGKEMEVKLNYARHINVQGYGLFSAGIGIGIENVGFQPKWNAPQTGTDASLDPNLPQGVSDTGFDVNFGLHWKGVQGYYVGLSATHLTQPVMNKVNFKKFRHYYIMAGYEIKASRQSWAYFLPDDLTVTPSLLLKTTFSSTAIDVNVMADFWLNTDMGVYGGITYRTAKADAAAFLIGFQMRRYNTTGGIAKGGALKGSADVLKIGYSYDMMTGPLAQYGYGSHEIMFNYCIFPPPPPVTRYGNVFILQ
jgi:type IX secretion system PorP/SprF family membrane protein